MDKLNNDTRPKTASINAKGHLEIAGLDVVELAKEYQTPLYLMDYQSIKENAEAYIRGCKSYPNTLVAYAGKANLCIGIATLMHQLGLGLDVVSEGELYTAIKSDMPMDKVFLHGNNKSLDCLTMALDHDVRVVLNGVDEAEFLLELASKRQKKARVLLRVTPGIEAHTHDYIKTGQHDSKFGISLEEGLALSLKLDAHPQIEFLGFHAHIGSQIFELEPYLDLVTVMVDLVEQFKRRTGKDLPELNLGGGLGIAYSVNDRPLSLSDSIEKICRRVKQCCSDKGLTLPMLIFEPGRSLVGTAGVTVYHVGSLKSISGDKTIASVDGGMADNPRPTLYQAEYDFAVANKADAPATHTYSVAGKFCESGDILGKNLRLPELKRDDVIVVFGTGAYNYSMSSNYNRCRRPAMVLLRDRQVKTLVRRENFDDVLRCDLT